MLSTIFPKLRPIMILPGSTHVKHECVCAPVHVHLYTHTKNSSRIVSPDEIMETLNKHF